MVAKKTNSKDGKSADATAKKKAGHKASKKPAARRKRAPKAAAAETPVEAAPKKTRSKSPAAADEAEKVLAGESDDTVVSYGDALAGDRKSAATQAARVLDEVVARKPEAVVPIIDRYVRVIGSAHKRSAQAAANALPQVAKIAPARVAKHLEKLKAAYEGATPPGKDGLVRTFAALCSASVAYQKRLEPILDQALGEAEPKMLLQWSQVVLPALKGEPHARARATVEGRLNRIPKATAQKIADFLGIKLRLRYR
jgi:hypothetical protein